MTMASSPDVYSVAGEVCDAYHDESSADWGSLNYSLRWLKCQEEQEEVTALEVTTRWIILQYHAQPRIDVFDRHSLQLAFSLDGHEYGGQCIQASADSRILYSGSMDRSLKSWDLETRCLIQSAQHHQDYVNTLTVETRSAQCDWVASGGRGDKMILVYLATSGTLQLKHKLRGHSGWIVRIVFLSGGLGEAEAVLSGSEDGSLRIWDLHSGECLHILDQDAAITCLLKCPGPGGLVMFGDKDGKMSVLDTDTHRVVHILPNVLIGMGKYCRSSKYHDKSIDFAFVDAHGFLITASQGSKFIKIWKRQSELDWELKELHMLRQHSDYLSVMKVVGQVIYSSCSDGRVCLHQFPARGSGPEYDMAEECDTPCCSSASISRHNGHLLDLQSCTELCLGPGRCKTGKTCLVKSSSSFQVSFQLRSSQVPVDSMTRVVAAQAILEEDGHQDDDSESSYSSDEYEVVYVTTDDEEPFSQ